MSLCLKQKYIPIYKKKIFQIYIYVLPIYLLAIYNNNNIIIFKAFKNILTLHIFQSRKIDSHVTFEEKSAKNILYNDR